MNIIDAIKSGKRFHRPDGDFLRAIRAEKCVAEGKTLEDVELCYLNLEDLLADDWEIEEEQITLTRSQFALAFAEGVRKQMNKNKAKYANFFGAEDIVASACAEIFKELGFKE